MRDAEQLQRTTGRALRIQVGAVEGEDLRVGDPVAGQGDRVVGDLGGPGGREARRTPRTWGSSWLTRSRYGAVASGDPGVHPAAVGVQVGARSRRRRRPPRRRRARLAHVDVGARRRAEVAADDEHVAAGVRRDLRTERGDADLVAAGRRRAKTASPSVTTSPLGTCRGPADVEASAGQHRDVAVEAPDGGPACSAGQVAGQTSAATRSWFVAKAAVAAGTPPITADAASRRCGNGPREGVAAWGRHESMFTSQEGSPQENRRIRPDRST